MVNNISNLLQKTFPKFGVNKQREINRLISEISRIEKISAKHLLAGLKSTDYEGVKKELLQKRYPKSYGKAPLDSFYLPKYEIDDSAKADTATVEFYPKNIFYQKSAADSAVFNNAEKLFPLSQFTEIYSLKSFKSSAIKDFNNRCDNLFIVEEKYDFFKKCPCTSGVVNCGYSIMNIGMGCPYECSYCFLQGYQNISGMVLPSNINEYLSDEKLISHKSGVFDIKRIGSGEFTDSLVFDHITGFSKDIIKFFKNRKEIFFEFKTKSINIKNLLETGGEQNLVAAWSVNSVKMCVENEFKTPSLKERLKAAAECAKAGFSTAFHFDPIIYYDGWRQDYKEAVDMIFDIVSNDSIKWISLGTLRMPAVQKQVMENRFPDSAILDGELLLGQDYKLRYSRAQRIEMYKHLLTVINSKKTKAVVYLCMEDAKVWEPVIPLSTFHSSLCR